MYFPRGMSIMVYLTFELFLFRLKTGSLGGRLVHHLRVREEANAKADTRGGHCVNRGGFAYVPIVGGPRRQ
jgi:hypothetical protein